MPVEVHYAGTASEKLKQLDAGVRSGIIRAGMFYISRVKHTFDLFQPRGVASGRLKRSLTVSTVKLVDGVYRARAGPTVDYGQYLHQGTGLAAGHGVRRPPPIDAILSWVKEKGLVPKIELVRARYATGRFAPGYAKKKRKARDITKDQKTLAFLIARKIGREGTKPFPFMTAPFKVYKAEMEKIIISDILRSLRSV